ncbi:toxin-antitoxin system HicB family antitoxin [Pseudomonas sp. 1152_12]|uniref:toxin-antitoxin system HicB family antitoxin n=1 Tax=Pseudomonas sp. 1152_12 TaxID=2604455 RepID=UPI004063BC6C
MNNQLKHNGYIGSIEACLEDNCLLGNVLFIKTLVSYEDKTVAELNVAFREANVRVGHDLHLATALAAPGKKVTLNNLTHQALSEFLQHNCADPCPAAS